MQGNLELPGMMRWLGLNLLGILPTKLAFRMNIRKISIRIRYSRYTYIKGRLYTIWIV